MSTGNFNKLVWKFLLEKRWDERTNLYYSNPSRMTFPSCAPRHKELSTEPQRPGPSSHRLFPGWAAWSWCPATIRGTKVVLCYGLLGPASFRTLEQDLKEKWRMSDQIKNEKYVRRICVYRFGSKKFPDSFLTKLIKIFWLFTRAICTW